MQVGDDGATGFIKRTDLGRDRDEQRPERFQVGQKFDAMVIGFDRSKKPNFSVKAMQIAEEKQAVAQYGSSDSGASLGDILGAALEGKGRSQREGVQEEEVIRKGGVSSRDAAFTSCLRAAKFPDSLNFRRPVFGGDFGAAVPILMRGRR